MLHDIKLDRALWRPPPRTHEHHEHSAKRVASAQRNKQTRLRNTFSRIVKPELAVRDVRAEVRSGVATPRRDRALHTSDMAVIFAVQRGFMRDDIERLRRRRCRQPFPCSPRGATVARMHRSPVELRVGGQTYRVVASAEEAELRRLADVVDARLRDLTGPGRPISPQAMLLAAIALAHDLEEERTRRRQVEARSREMLTSLLERIDKVLEETSDATSTQDGEPASPDR